MGNDLGFHAIHERFSEECVGRLYEAPHRPQVQGQRSRRQDLSNQRDERGGRVVPRRLLDQGFVFNYPHWPEAATDLYRRWQRARS